MDALQRAKTLFLTALEEQARAAWPRAETLLREALSLAPGRASIQVNLAAVLLAQRQHAQAITLCQQVLASDPDNANAWLNLGLGLNLAERYAEALAALQRAAALDANASVSAARARALHGLGRWQESLAQHQAALAEAPEDITLICGHVDALLKLERAPEALHTIRDALQRHPAEPALLNACGNAQLAMRLREEACQSYRAALQRAPDEPAILSNLASALTQLDRPREAVRYCEQALSQHADHYQALQNRAHALAELNQVDAALADYARCLNLRPQAADAYKLRWNHAQLLLLKGDFATGWPAHECRRQRPEQASLLAYTQPLWLGETPLAGRRLLVHAEQGLGDTLQFCRYLPVLAQLGAEVIFSAPRSLHVLLKGLEGINTLIAPDAPMPAHDLQCPLMSLPLALRAIQPEIPSRSPYLSCEPRHIARWQTRLPADKLLIGLTWSGNPQFPNDHKRSMSLAQLLPALDTRFRYVCLHKDIRPNDRALLATHPDILVFSSEFDDFTDCSALASRCDLVISTDTSIAHLAGALGKKLWLMLSFAPDWRWQLEREDSPWYPSARLFRQQAPGDWTGVVARIREALQEEFRP
jgi:tetratricopeptide (TPR) repeat protein